MSVGLFLEGHRKPLRLLLKSSAFSVQDICKVSPHGIYLHHVKEKGKRNKNEIVAINGLGAQDASSLIQTT